MRLGVATIRKKIFYIMYIFVFVFSLFIFSCNSAKLSTGDSIPEFTKMEWVQSPPLKLSELTGKVVLLRWWTDQCGFCINSAEALNTWHQTYKDSGLIIIGLYHPKPEPIICNPENVRAFAHDKEFRFAIAIDDLWLNLKKIWLDNKPNEFTSASFLIGKNGKIIYIHPGGEYHHSLQVGHEQCVEDFFELQEQIQKAVRSK